MECWIYFKMNKKRKIKIYKTKQYKCSIENNRKIYDREKLSTSKYIEAYVIYGLVLNQECCELSTFRAINRIGHFLVCVEVYFYIFIVIKNINIFNEL